jgi:low temperature requirement protein LtrA
MPPERHTDAHHGKTGSRRRGRGGRGRGHGRADHHAGPRPTDLSAPEAGEDWLEVFYDIIFGVAVIEVADYLNEDPTLERFLVFVGLLLPTWWVWLGWTVYVSRFDADDVPHRLLTFAQMLAMAGMAVQVHLGQEGSAIFAGAFVAARVCLLVLYVRARLRMPEVAPVTAVYFRGFGLGALLWAVSIFVPPPARFWLWAAGLGVDLVTPWVGRRALRRAPLHAPHLLHRMGAFNSIVLAVAVTGVVTGVADEGWNVRAVVAAVFGFTLAVCLWWIRASLEQRPGVKPAIRVWGLPFVYSHLAIVLGLAMMSVGVRRLIVRAATEEYEPAAFWLLGGGAAVWLATSLGTRALLLHQRRPQLFATYVCGIGVSLTLPLVGRWMATPVGLGLMAALFVGLLVLEYRCDREAGCAA